MARIFRFLLWAAQFPSQTQTKKLAKFCAQVLVLCRATAARDTRTNLALCFPELNPRQLDQWVHESLVNLCLLFFEFAQFAFWPKEKLLGQITTVEGKERLDATVHQRRQTQRADLRQQRESLRPSPIGLGGGSRRI